MPHYVAFLRAINLGATRKFPKDAIKRATEAAGATGVETYINTGNVRLTHPARSVAKVSSLLEAAYDDEAGFAVPTVVFTAADLKVLADRGDELHAEHAPTGQHYVTLFATAPDPAAVEAVHRLDLPGERCAVVDRAAYVLLDGTIQGNRLMNTREFKALGQGTARTLKVLRTVRDKWC